jgi:signal transduction histidine kinase
MVKINVFETEVDHILKIKVRDTGCGMKEEQVQRLFSLFQNLKFRKNINQNGMGLGLTICKKIVDAMRGKITCNSMIDVGTTIIIEIPIDPVE